jgi:hypothetical protein
VDLGPLTSCESYVGVSDGESTTTTGPVWHFTTGSDGLKGRVLSPNGGETLTIGSEVSLQWDALSARPLVGATEMSAAVPRESHVRVSVYDMLRRTVDVLVDGVLRPGRSSVVWDCGAARGGVSSGVYFVKMEAPGKEITKKVVLVR